MNDHHISPQLPPGCDTEWALRRLAEIMSANRPCEREALVKKRRRLVELDGLPATSRRLRRLRWAAILDTLWFPGTYPATMRSLAAEAAAYNEVVAAVREFGREALRLDIVQRHRYRAMREFRRSWPDLSRVAQDYLVQSSAHRGARR